MYKFPELGITWDEEGERYFETGTKHGALFVYDTAKKEYGPAVEWNGLSAVTESPSGADANDIYADDMKYLSLRAAETFGGTIEAYTYPQEFAECDGSVIIGKAGGTTMKLGQQKRKKFAFAFTSVLGDDTEGIDHAMKLHIIYGATCSPSERAYQTINDSPEAITFSWEFTTDPLAPSLCVIDGIQYKSVSNITIDLVGEDDGTPTAAEKSILETLYGKGSTKGKLLYPTEIYDIINETATSAGT